MDYYLSSRSREARRKGGRWLRDLRLRGYLANGRSLSRILCGEMIDRWSDSLLGSDRSGLSRSCSV